MTETTEVFSEGNAPSVLINGSLLMLDDAEYTLVYRTDDDGLIIADIYFEEFPDGPIGTIEFASDGDSATITDNYSNITVEIRRVGDSRSIPEDVLPADFGEVKDYPEISDIVGMWKATEPDEEGVYGELAVSSAAIIGYYAEGSGYFVYLNPREGGFDMFAPDVDSNYEVLGGRIAYSEETDKMFILFDDGTGFTFERTGDADRPPYYGKWKLDPSNPPADVQYVVLDIDEYFLVLDYEYHYKDYFIIRDIKNTSTGVSFVIYMDNLSDHSLGYKFEYDHGADTIKMTQIGLGEETPMQFVRAD